jgi:hypothetical protein
MSAAIDAIVADARWRRRIPDATREVLAGLGVADPYAAEGRAA